MIPFIAIMMVLFVVVCAVIIVCSNKIGKLDLKAKDLGSEIDTLIWDNNHKLKCIADILNEKKIEHSIEPEDMGMMVIGMNATLQMVKCMEIEKQKALLDEVLEKHPEIREDEKAAVHLTKLDKFTKEIVPASLAYNKAANAFNSYIAVFPASLIASYQKKSSKEIFVYTPTYKENA